MPIKQTSFIILLAIALLSGCAQRGPSSPTTLTEAQAEFERVCKDELGFEAVTRLKPHTFWIYIPMSEAMFDYKASPKLPPGFDSKPQQYSVEYLDGNFNQGTFRIEYDIIKNIKPPKDYGYSTSYGEAFTKLQVGILQNALPKTFFSLEPEETPDFFVMVIADVTRGIEFKSIFHFQDIKRYIQQSLAYEDYIQRNVTEIRGDQVIIGDTAGRHLKFEDMTWTDFLSKQMVNRVRFKFQQSDFPPEGDLPQEILSIASDTVRAYDFTDFQQIRVVNVRNGQEFSLQK